MSTGPELSLLSWFLSSLPVFVLIVTIMGFKWSAPRAGGISWLVAAGLALWFFGGNSTSTAIASAKGLSLALFVLSILWASVYMYNIVDRVGGIQAIGKALARIAHDPLAQALLIAWGLASFIQGITGFGVPVAVATPLLMMMGFRPAKAATMVLIGHGWAVTFGSMGSSYYTIQLVTEIPGTVIAPHMALLLAPVTILSGFIVAQIQGGMAAVKRAAPLILVIGFSMAFAMWAMAWIEAPQVASSVPGIIALAGVAVGLRVPFLFRSDANSKLSAKTEGIESSMMNPHLGFMPYYLLILFSLIVQLGAIKDLTRNIAWGIDYPGFMTSKGFVVHAVSDYAVIRMLYHPAPLIIFSLLISAIALAYFGYWKKSVAVEAAVLTYKQSMSTTVGVGTMVMMALIMADTGMTTLLAYGIAKGSGPIFPLVSPFIGLLGSFMTGSNTNSNGLFGILQVETARNLEIGAVTIASVQSIGASVGSTMAPAKVLLGAALTGLAGREHEIMRLVVPYVLILVGVTGVVALILVELFPGWTK